MLGDARYAPFSIQPLACELLDRVMVIEALCFKEPWPRDAFMLFLSHPSVKGVVVCDKFLSLVGYAVFGVRHSEGELLNIAIHPCYQRQGVGTMLLEYVHRALEDMAARACYLEVRSGNAAARSFYHKMGYQQVTRYINFDAIQGEDALVMRAMLV